MRFRDVCRVWSGFHSRIGSRTRQVRVEVPKLTIFAVKTRLKSIKSMLSAVYVVEVEYDALNTQVVKDRASKLS